MKTSRLSPLVLQMVFNLRESIQSNTAARIAAELANRSKSEFLANMSRASSKYNRVSFERSNVSRPSAPCLDEIRTPMNGIIGVSG